MIWVWLDSSDRVSSVCFVAEEWILELISETFEISHTFKEMLDSLSWTPSFISSLEYFWCDIWSSASELNPDVLFEESLLLSRLNTPPICLMIVSLDSTIAQLSSISCFKYFLCMTWSASSVQDDDELDEGSLLPALLNIPLIFFMSVSLNSLIAVLSPISCLEFFLCEIWWPWSEFVYEELLEEALLSARLKMPLIFLFKASLDSPRAFLSSISCLEYFLCVKY